MRFLLKTILIFTLVIGVSLSYLHSTSEAATVSYLKDTRYSYIYNFLGSQKIYKFEGKEKSGNLWGISDLGRYYPTYAELEVQNKNGFFLQTRNDTDIYRSIQVIKFPMKKGLKWSVKSESDIKLDFTILSTNKTVNVRAGTFKNVVEVKMHLEGFDKGSYQKEYYAKGAGLILSSRYINNKYAGKSIELIKKYRNTK
ncbi:hypothetical protein [Peribacillus sp. SCS-155]|uniref:hypothetical protein n=1 Tax=Peribacillus sedimenti TaxID=3115297 RepID=UPI00390656BC